MGTKMRIVRTSVALTLFAAFMVFAQKASAQTTINGHEAVDLGLSVKWASCNIGATTPEAHGNYYSWGETATKARYDDENCTSLDKPWGDITGDSSRDAARANWGSSWRLPTLQEAKELIEKCNWKWTGSGYTVTGPNGKSIFLPAAGYKGRSVSYEIGEGGYYQTSTPDSMDDQSAHNFRFDKDGKNWNWSLRDLGLSVRPVTE